MVRWLVGGPIERARGGVCELALTWRLKLNPGPLPPAQILICQNLRNNLQHPNEFIRGVTLRFLCRIHEEELLEPLVPSGVCSGGARRDSRVRRLGSSGRHPGAPTLPLRSPRAPPSPPPPPHAAQSSPTWSTATRTCARTRCWRCLPFTSCPRGSCWCLTRQSWWRSCWGRRQTCPRGATRSRCWPRTRRTARWPSSSRTSSAWQTGVTSCRSRCWTSSARCVDARVGWVRRGRQGGRAG